MDHVAIMNKSWGMIPKILSGQKTIESRWYKTKRSPRNTIKAGDVIYFKDSGSPVTATARVKGVLQYVINSVKDIDDIIQQYGEQICLIQTNPRMWLTIPHYCVLVHLDKPSIVPPFHINKTGFGMGCAWLTLKDIKTIKI